MLTCQKGSHMGNLYVSFLFKGVFWALLFSCLFIVKSKILYEWLLFTRENFLEQENQNHLTYRYVTLCSTKRKINSGICKHVDHVNYGKNYHLQHFLL